MTSLNLVQPVSCGQSQYLLQALSAHSSCRFSIDTSQGIENYFEGGEKILFRRILLRTIVIVCIPHFCTIPRTAVALTLNNRLHNCANLFSLSGTRNQCCYSLSTLHGFFVSRIRTQQQLHRRQDTAKVLNFLCSQPRRLSQYYMNTAQPKQYNLQNVKYFKAC